MLVQILAQLHSIQLNFLSSRNDRIQLWSYSEGLFPRATTQFPKSVNHWQGNYFRTGIKENQNAYLVTRNAGSLTNSTPTRTCPCLINFTAVAIDSAIFCWTIINGKRRRQNELAVTWLASSKLDFFWMSPIMYLQMASKMLLYFIDKWTECKLALFNWETRENYCSGTVAINSFMFLVLWQMLVSLLPWVLLVIKFDRM